MVLRRSTHLAMVAVLPLALLGCGNPPYPRGDVQSLFPNGKAPVAAEISAAGRHLHAMRMPGQPGKPMLLFIHGSPGDWKAWAAYLADPRLAQLGDRVAVDRPGFGASTGAVVTDLRQQAAQLTQWIPPGQKAIVVGHSLGGPLAAWMALDAPEKVCGVVSIAGAMSSQREQPRWYNRAAEWRVVQWLIPPEMTLSNQEMLPLASELQRLEAALPRLQVPFVVLQGGQDELVMSATADDVAERIPAPWLRVLKQPADGHFLLWQKPSVVTDAILQLPCAAAGTPQPH
jgi:pimeloyl-ACP methyl ester carboxylesterase